MNIGTVVEEGEREVPGVPDWQSQPVTPAPAAKPAPVEREPEKVD